MKREDAPPPLPEQLLAAERERCAQIAEMSHPQDWAFIGASIRNQKA